MLAWLCLRVGRDGDSGEVLEGTTGWCEAEKDSGGESRFEEADVVDVFMSDYRKPSMRFHRERRKATSMGTAGVTDGMGAVAAA
jgi:hypothetical protein